MREMNITRTWGQRTATATLKRLLFGAVALLFAASCTDDGQRNLVGLGPKGLARIPSFSTSTATPSGATFTTDKDDYAPGETVHLSGTGWQPADVLDIHLDVTPQNHSPLDWTVTVGDDGNFTGSYLVQDSDAGATLTISATSEATGETATATFTDGTNSCPNGNAIGNFVTSNRVGASATLNTNTATYKFEAFVSEGSNGVPGLIEYCVYSDHQPTSVTPQVQGADGSDWVDPQSFDNFSFERPDGNPSNIPYDNSSHTMGTATYTSGQTGNFDRILLHINDAVECDKLYGGNPGTCFVYPGTGGGGQAGKPEIDKTASGSYDNTYAWDITKDVDKTIVKQIGGSATFTYTVKVSHDDGTISNVTVSGTITVSNPNSANITGATITDVLTDGVTTCTVTNGTNVTLTPGNNSFPYTCSLGGLPSTTPDNKATVTWPAQSVGGASLAADSKDVTKTFSFAKNDIDECVSVSDSYGGTLGTACVGDANPKSFTYSRTITVPQFDCKSYDNTATFTTNDTGTTGSAGQTVTVCGPAKTGALTIGFWKTTNGQNLIKTYCANTLDDYLAGLGGGSGPFSDAAGKNCTQLAQYVFNILSGASASNMNSMLKAQMLGTALDVWFSGSGWTSTKIGGTKPPSNFLSHNNLGTFKMDLTAVCPMVDNTSTGTAACLSSTPSTDAVASGAVSTSPMSMQAILDFAATTPTPFIGSTSSSVWYGGNRTNQEILKNIFDQFNNQMAFGSF